MFVLDLNPIFTREVKVATPAGKGHEDETFVATFRALPLDEVQQFDLDSAAGTDKFLLAVLRAVDDVIDGEGNPVPSSPDLVAQLIALPHVRTGLLRAYRDGFRDERAGN